jgi:hypothetical protein
MNPTDRQPIRRDRFSDIKMLFDTLHSDQTLAQTSLLTPLLRSYLKRQFSDRLLAADGH